MVSTCCSSKSLGIPGPDGFHLNIFDWFRNASVPENLCNALICLIPKVDNPTTVRQLRPISLCNIINKVVTKIIVQSILKSVIPEWISTNQNGFIKRRGPEVNIVVATEILHSMNKKMVDLGGSLSKLT